MPRRIAARPMARYMAPVSMCGRLSSRATSLLVVVFPTPDGPSMATMSATQPRPRRVAPAALRGAGFEPRGVAGRGPVLVRGDDDVRGAAALRVLALLRAGAALRFFADAFAAVF